MLSLFRHFARRKQPPTFAARVAEFWQWFATNSDRFLKTIDDKRCDELQPEMSAQMSRLYPGAAWVFGPGENGIGHSFTFTAEADAYRQLLTAYWLQQAPKLPSWTFYGSRQPNDSIDSWKIRFDGIDFEPKEFWLTPHIDEQSEKIDLTVWHPQFPKIEERAQWTSTFLCLDEVLGELGTQSWIGHMKLEDTRLTESMPLTEFASFVDSVVQKRGWQLSMPGESWSCYQRKEPNSETLRRDIVVGTTCLFRMVREAEDGHMDHDPLEDTGADLVYVVLPRSALTPGNEAGSRGPYEDALVAALGSSGRLLGGATGTDHAYIDLLLFDGAASVELVKQTLKRLGLGRGTAVEYFARNRAAGRVRL